MTYQKIALALAAIFCSTAASAAVYTQVTLTGSAPFQQCSGGTPFQCANYISHASATFTFGADETSILMTENARVTSNSFSGQSQSFFPGPDGSFRFNVNFLSPVDLNAPGQYLGFTSVTGQFEMVHLCGRVSTCTVAGTLDSFSLQTSEAPFGPTGVVYTAGIGPGAALPEPAAWAMMVVGFGAVGLAMRRRSKVRHTISFA